MTQPIPKSRVLPIGRRFSALLLRSGFLFLPMALAGAMLLFTGCRNTVPEEETASRTSTSEKPQATALPAQTDVPPAKQSLPAGTYVFDSLVFNLDGDAWPDKLLVLEPESNRTKEGFFHPAVIYRLLRGTGQNAFTLWGENEILLNQLGNNCPADGYQHLVAKPPYFTIEQIICTDFEFANQYITFKYDKAANKVLLHKWGEEYTDRSNPDNPLADFIHTPADFGTIPFDEASRGRVVEP